MFQLNSVDFQNDTLFSTVLPIDLIPNEEYRMTIFSMNDQLCHSDDVVVTFSTLVGKESTTERHAAYLGKWLLTASSFPRLTAARKYVAAMVSIDRYSDCWMK